MLSNYQCLRRQRGEVCMVLLVMKTSIFFLFCRNLVDSPLLNEGPFVYLSLVTSADFVKLWLMKTYPQVMLKKKLALYQLLSSQKCEKKKKKTLAQQRNCQRT